MIIDSFSMLAQTGAGAQRNSGALNRSTLDEISAHFDSGAMIPLEWIAIASGLVIVVISTISWYRRHKTRHLRSHPSAVFRRAAREARLSFSQQMLLWRIARQQALPTPLTLLLSATTLRHHASAYASTKSKEAEQMVLAHVEEIRNRMNEP